MPLSPVNDVEPVYRALLLQGLFFFAQVCSYKNSLLNGVSVATIITMEITFDPAKDKSNQRKHGMSLSLAQEIDWPEVMAKPDDRRDYGEVREIGYTVMHDRLYCVVFTQRGDKMHVISLRKANSREIRNYVEQT